MNFNGIEAIKVLLYIESLMNAYKQKNELWFIIRKLEKT